MTANDFRRIALGLTEAIEASHMGHPDFRVNGRIFATLHADDKHGMVKLPPDEQERFVREHPEVFRPENGAWGRQGCTRVQLRSADEDTVGEAMTLAWRDASAKKKPAGRSKTRRPAGAKKSARTSRTR